VATLTQALAAGDPEAFAAVYDRFAARLFAVATTMTGSATEAEDIVHDLFVDLATHRQRFARVTDLDAYLFTTLRHAVSRHWRRCSIHRKAVDRIQREHAREATYTDQPAPDEALAAALAALPASQREVISLKIDGGLTFAEIAGVTNTRPNTAASRYRYALSQLRRLLTRKQKPQRHHAKTHVPQ
jgi:RNA polymerase sigma-70 factor (ECF subfamily)